MVSEKKEYQLGMMIHLNNWDSIRNNYSLMIDCIYIIGKKHKVGITIESMIVLTRKLYGKSTQPKPHLWRNKYGY